MNDFLHIALSEASIGIKNNDGGPFGAVIVHNHKVISCAHNEVLKTNDPTAHAEILAIRRASEALKTYSLKDCEIYTTCEPCPMCLGAILWARIPKIYYAASRGDASSLGFDDESIYDVINSNAHSEKIIMTQIDKENSMLMMKRWSQKPDKIIY